MMASASRVAPTAPSLPHALHPPGFRSCYRSRRAGGGANPSPTAGARRRRWRRTRARLRPPCANSCGCSTIRGSGDGSSGSAPARRLQPRQPLRPRPLRRRPPDQLAARLEAVRAHLRSVAAAAPRLPAEIERASSLLFGEMKERGLVEILLLLVGFVALGYGVEWLFWTATASLRRWIGEPPGPHRRRAPAARGLAARLRAFSRRGLRDRQHRRLPGLRLAAAAQGGRALLSPRPC